MTFALLGSFINTLYTVFQFLLFSFVLSAKPRVARHQVLWALLYYAGAVVLSLPRLWKPISASPQSNLVFALLAVAQCVYQFLFMTLGFSGQPLQKLGLYFAAKILEVVGMFSALLWVTTCHPDVLNRVATHTARMPWDLLLYYLSPNLLVGLLYWVAARLWRTVLQPPHRAWSRSLLLLLPIAQITLLLVVNYTLLSSWFISPLAFWVVGICTLGDLLLFHTMNRLQLAEQENIYRQQIEMQQQYYALLEAQQNQIRQMQHDMKNHLDALQRMDDSQARQQYINRLSTELSTTKLHYCDAPAVNALLVNKMSQSKQLGLSLSCQIALPHPNAVDAFDLVTLLSNILDNAFEAVGEAAPEQRSVSLHLLQAQNTITITCENPLPKAATKPIFLLDGAKVSRGNGMAIIRKTAKKYGGAPVITKENGLYRIALVLMLKE